MVHLSLNPSHQHGLISSQISYVCCQHHTTISKEVDYLVNFQGQQNGNNIQRDIIKIQECAMMFAVIAHRGKCRLWALRNGSVSSKLRITRWNSLTTIRSRISKVLRRHSKKDIDKDLSLKTIKVEVSMIVNNWSHWEVFNKNKNLEIKM